MKIVKIVSLIVAFALSVIVPAAVLALDGTPAADPSVDNIHGFKDLVLTGDVAIFGEYNIPYTTLPSTPASSTYTIKLMDAGGNQVGAVVPYATFDLGYNLGAFGLYFSPGAVTFGGTYTIRISQNPVYFASPESFDYEIPALAWTTATTQADNRVKLALAVLATAERLHTQYPTYTLLESGLSGTVLYSPTGENYFRGAFYGIQAMAPSLFLYEVAPYETTSHVYTENMSANYTSRYGGTWVGPEVTATANQFGLTATAVMAMIFALPVCLGFIIVSAKKFHKTEPGFLVSALVVLTVYMMGWMPAAIFATIYQICGIYLGYVWFYARG